ncbi:hypothetical protein BDN72DRAFT_955493 [Pluteus cervinus]|uniref:Uncharacterized protein n=1 Tax=Pluteus cervinus TaxID=181527 RepID=A0ACD3BB06_9AGAR|nr:hypothetical protein BDN72DRAFT_955493 [Pluteus cervinus]
MAGALELLTFQASPAYLKDRSIFNGIFKEVLSALGCKGLYFGQQLEDEKTGYLLIVWETYEHHKALIDSAGYGQIVAQLKTGIDETAPVPFELIHIPLDTDPTAALEAEVTEVAIFTPKADKVETVIPELRNLEQELNKVKGSRPPSTLNEVREKPGNWGFIVGWDSVEAHTSAVQVPAIKAIIDKVLGSKDATATMGHVALSKFVSS